ncbi:tRNA-specific adenosine deaminase [bacterium]|nr:tRNA-specific adenosine deaminase [bacterium]|tara:strand:+ start:5234 stop:5698 length:465 start_codon:yes stop_codon:yes gene_type:complete
MTDSFFDLALQEAKYAYDRDEVPVGAVIVCNEQVLVKTHNRKQAQKDGLAHAEILAIQEAQNSLNDWRLTECDLYVTLEPCVMCMGAIFHARFRRLIYGTPDYKWGGESLFNMLSEPKLNHHLEFTCLESSESAQLLTSFFQQKRQKKKKENSC